MQLRYILLATLAAGSAQAQVYPTLECVESPPVLTGTPLEGFPPFDWTRTFNDDFGADVTLDVYRAHFSYANIGAQKSIPRGVSAHNYFTPGKLVGLDQPSTFYGGYHRAIHSRPIGFRTTPWDVSLWHLDNHVPVLPTNISDAAASTFCPVTLAPLFPVVLAGAMPVRVKIAALAASVAGPLTVVVLGSYQTVSSNNIPNHAAGIARDVASGSATNAVVEGGFVYADVQGASTDSRVTMVRLRVLSGSAVVAFGHVPVIVAAACPVTLAGALPNASLGSAYTASLGAATGYTYILSGTLPPGLSLNGSTLSGAPTIAGIYPVSLSVHSGDRGCYSQANFNLTVNGPSCAADVTSQVSYSFTGLTRNLATGIWSQTVTLQNRATTPLAGPVTMVLTGLSPNATLTNSQGLTTCAAPSGQPFVQSGGTVGANQTISFPLTFTNAQANQSITYTLRVLAGGTQQ